MPKPRLDLDQATLRSVVHYDPASGVFTWLRRAPKDRHAKTWNARYAGKPAGWSISNTGYFAITLEVAGKKSTFTAHRLAWLYVHGELPTLQIDHINGVRSDNRIDNLRLATQSNNSHNMVMRRDNTSGVKGVSWYVRHQRWSAKIHISGTCLFLGYFDKIEDAQAAYEAASLSHAKEFSVFSEVRSQTCTR